MRNTIYIFQFKHLVSQQTLLDNELVLDGGSLQAKAIRCAGWKPSQGFISYFSLFWDDLMPLLTLLHLNPF
ncbi:hypothetical protein BGS_1042 [Beggiatoa sp. SS]|nr:hypothetical protein BGS_1042 [Beggiatoa sp. SS]